MSCYYLLIRKGQEDEFREYLAGHSIPGFSMRQLNFTDSSRMMFTINASDLDVVALQLRFDIKWKCNVSKGAGKQHIMRYT